MNRRQRKKAAKKEIAAAFKALVEFEPKGDEPCDDCECESCYRDAGPHYNFP